MPKKRFEVVCDFTRTVVVEVEADDDYEAEREAERMFPVIVRNSINAMSDEDIVDNFHDCEVKEVQ